MGASLVKLTWFSLALVAAVLTVFSIEASAQFDPIAAVRRTETTVTAGPLDIYAGVTVEVAFQAAERRPHGQPRKTRGVFATIAKAGPAGKPDRTNSCKAGVGEYREDGRFFLRAIYQCREDGRFPPDLRVEEPLLRDGAPVPAAMLTSGRHTLTLNAQFRQCGEDLLVSLDALATRRGDTVELYSGGTDFVYLPLAVDAAASPVYAGVQLRSIRAGSQATIVRSGSEQQCQE